MFVAAWKLRPVDGPTLLDPRKKLDAHLRFFYPFTSILAKNRGAFLAFVACSNPYASRINTGSLHARPKNEIPTGKPNTNPAGTLMFGYPATAAGADLPPPK